MVSKTIARTLTARVRPRCTREHRALERLFAAANSVHNALVEQELGIRRVNRNRILRHREGWTPERFAETWEEAREDPEALVKHPRKFDLGKQWTDIPAADKAPGHGQGSQRLTGLALGRRLLTGIFSDFCRRYERPGAPPPRFRPVRKLRSVAVCEARVAFDGHRDLVLRVQGLPALRARLRERRKIDESAKVGTTVRIVREREGLGGCAPGRWTLRLTLTDRVRTRAEAERTVIAGWDPGGRAALTNDRGDVVTPGKRRYLRRQQRACARTRRGSNNRRKAHARLAKKRADETRRRTEHVKKQVAYAVRGADVHAIETNAHARMRRRGGKRKAGMNRSLADAAPAKTAAMLEHQCAKSGRATIEVNPYRNSRQCVHCASNDTKLTRTRLRCRGCGTVTPRDQNAAGNAALKAIAEMNGGVAPPRGHNREVAVRRGSILAARCPVARESLGLTEHALASWGPRKSPISGHGEQEPP